MSSYPAVATPPSLIGWKNGSYCAIEAKILYLQAGLKCMGSSNLRLAPTPMFFTTPTNVSQKGASRLVLCAILIVYTI